MQNIVKSILPISIITYFVLGIFLFLGQDNLLYFPTSQIKHNYNEEIFLNDDISIMTTVLNIGNENAIIYFGGNAEIVEHDADKFSNIFAKHTVYLVNYRGYGGSTGKPSEHGIYSDAIHIYDKIKSKYKTISVIGRSLGSGVATLLASKREIDKLVLITPFDSIQNVAQKKLPFYPISVLLRDRYDSIGRVELIKAKTLIITAQKDQVIDKEHSENLIAEFPPSQVRTIIIKDVGHNTISNSESYYKWLKEFINSMERDKEEL